MATTEQKTPAIAVDLGRRPRLHLVYTGEQVVSPPRVFGPLRGATMIGREVDTGVRLEDDRKASRHHATVHAGPTGALRLVDEGSRNGTLVNGVRVTEQVLRDGDVVAIGDSYLVVRDQAAEVADAAIPSLIGPGPALRALRATIARLAPTMTTVLVEAETGCGKELVARALHALGRPRGPFVAVNCAAIPESLAESQLFGQLAGTFTGGVARPGWFRAADGGTLFLDELGDLPLAIQPKLLRAVQDRAVVPVGATAPVPCDVRIVAATNHDLRAAIDAGTFRADLYARLAEHPLTIPPLRARREDLLSLLDAALGAPRRLAPSLVEALMLHPFRWNVREVQTLAAQLRDRTAPDAVLDLAAVADLLAAPPSSDPSAAPSSPADPPPAERPPPSRAELAELMRTHRGVVADVARAMGRSRKQVYRWLEHHGLDATSYR